MRPNRYKILVNANPSRPLTVGRGTFSVTERTGKTQFVLENDQPSGRSLLYTAETTDVTLENAMRKVLSYTKGTASHLAYWTGVGIPVVRLDRGWEITPKKHEGEFVQYAYHIPLEPVQPIVFDPGGFIETADHLHAKIVIVDDKELYIGSANLVAPSMNRNLEAGICTSDARTVSQALVYFEEAFSAAFESRFIKRKE